jgi:mannose-6-phosphate isomerase
MTVVNLGDRLASAKRWAIDDALPLWASKGFDAKEGLFEEQLSFDGVPILTAPRRVMVQARQISVYCLATQLGWFDGRSLALMAGQTMVERYWAADGGKGWVFSLDRNGQVFEKQRDLYAHAFVLFALAWLVKLSPEPQFIEAINRTLWFLDESLADAINGGFWDALPRPDAFRRQNPHMHLLEAYLELFAATENRGFLDRAARLVQLSLHHFIGHEHGALREIFDESWSVSPASGSGSVEPGHQFEWAWLLRRFDNMSRNQTDDKIRRLVQFALVHGTDRVSGRIVDETSEDGTVRQSRSRLWPHMEAVKSLTVETVFGGSDYIAELTSILARVQRVYCPAALKGGWIDHVSETDCPISVVMPASSLYHIIFGLSEVWGYFGRP